MAAMDPGTLLAAHPLFARLPGEVRANVAVRMVVRRYRRGAVIFTEGEPATALHIVGSGTVRILKRSPSGREQTLQQVDVNKVLNGQPDYVVFNGYANQYKDAPLAAKVGKRVRLYIVNAGPNDFSAFHVIGTIFENAYADGNTANAQHGMQTVTIPPGGGYMVEFTIPNPGTYAFVTHSFAGVNKGAVGVLKVTQ